MGDFDLERAIAGLTGRQGGISALDASRLARKKAKLDEEASAFELGEAKAVAPFKRTQADLQTQGMADDLEGKRLKLDTQRAEFDPSSEYSKTMKRSLAAQFRSFANALQQRGAPETGMFAKAADDIEQNQHLGAAQVLEAVKPLAEAAGFNLKALHDQATESMSRAQLGLSQAQLGETRRMHDAQISNMEEDNKRTFDMTVKKPQEKLNREINEIEVGLGEMKELAEKKEKVNTGPVVSFFLDTLGLGKIDEFKSADRKDLEALAARVFNKETKQIAGATVTPSEWGRIEPMIPKARGDTSGPADDDEAFKTKLARAIKEADRILAARRKEYQRTPTGATIDSSITAQEANAQAKPTMTAEDKQALIWFNDPANAKHPSRAAVGNVLRRKGLLK
jgi:hypothetical protein